MIKDDYSSGRGKLSFRSSCRTLKYRINGGGVGIIGGGGLEMVRDNNNRGDWNNRGGLLGEIENSPFLR